MCASGRVEHGADPSRGYIVDPTVFYSVMGTGALTHLFVYADFDVQIDIFKGEDCDRLECVFGNKESPLPGISSAASLILENEQLFYILIHGVNEQTGDFSLQVTPVDPADNIVCDGANPIKLGIPISDSTFYATTVDNGLLPFCG